MTRVVGLDLSLTATGVASTGHWRTYTPKTKGMHRLIDLRECVCGPIIHVSDPADLVVIEGYSFNSRVGGEHLGELGGVVRLALYEAGIAYVDVPPSTVKKFATGKGNAPKDAVLVAAVRAGFAGDDNNAADAWWLRQMGLYAVDVPNVLTTAYRNEAAAKVTWPRVGLLADDVPSEVAG